MPVNRSQFLIHTIFSTKDQKPLITEEIEPLLYDRISKILFDKCHAPALIIGGERDHIHILYAHPRNWTIDAIVDFVKKHSSEWMQDKKGFEDFAWQESYGAFSVSRSKDEFEKEYIRNQKQFHKDVSFKDEFREFLKKHEIYYDEKEVWE